MWNRFPDGVREQVVQLALDEPELSPRELATRFTDTAVRHRLDILAQLDPSWNVLAKSLEKGR